LGELFVHYRGVPVPAAGAAAADVVAWAALVGAVVEARVVEGPAGSVSGAGGSAAGAEGLRSDGCRAGGSRSGGPASVGGVPPHRSRYSCAETSSQPYNPPQTRSALRERWASGDWVHGRWFLMLPSLKRAGPGVPNRHSTKVGPAALEGAGASSASGVVTRRYSVTVESTPTGPAPPDDDGANRGVAQLVPSVHPESCSSDATAPSDAPTRGPATAPSAGADRDVTRDVFGPHPLHVARHADPSRPDASTPP